MSFLNIFPGSNQTLQQVQVTEKLAQDKQLSEAIKIAQKLISTWYEKPSFPQLWFRKLFLENDLNKLEKQLKKWRKQLAEANKLITHAQMQLEQDSGNPLETQYLINAIAFYERASKLICDNTVTESIQKYQQELANRSKFQKLIVEAELERENRFFKNAIAIYHQAEQLYLNEAIKQAIATCQTKIKQEETYCRTLVAVNQAKETGKLKTAIALLNSALTNFPRCDGIELLKQLQITFQGKEKFRSGLKAEKSGNLQQAEKLYRDALNLLSDTECQIRLGVVSIKLEKWVAALDYLENVKIEQAAYLRGFVRAKQGDLAGAAQEWQDLSGNKIQAEKQIIQTISQWQKLLSLQNIQQLVKEQRLVSAKTASIEFINKHGKDTVVLANLNEHIQPSIEASLWQNSDWGTILDTVEQAWIAEPNMTNLHNWTVAAYYRARNDFTPTQIKSVKTLIVALSTALANLHDDSTLKEVSWMGQTVDLAAVSMELKQRLSDIIDSFKDRNIPEYLELRDRYRLETVALNLMGNPPVSGIKVKQLFITPGCHHRYLDSWKDILVDEIEQQEILRSLYTPWGLAVAACVEGDIPRAMQLKRKQPTGEIFASRFVAYHEGCDCLKQHQWRSAIVPLKQAQTAIKATGEWEKEVDRLCRLQRQAISELTEHLEFAEFWYSLLASQAARSYLAEYKTEEIREQLVNQQIASAEALKQLQEIKKIDPQNPVASNLITIVEYRKEIEEIQLLFNTQKYDQAVKKAKRSHNTQVKFSVAKFLIESLIESVNKDLGDYQIIQQLGQWAYEICPDEPAFQEVYRSLKIAD